MTQNFTRKLEDLLLTGEQLAPLGGFDFSGYNARLQPRYQEWRSSVLESLELLGPSFAPYKAKILADVNGGFFYQSSVHLILKNLKEVLEKVRSSPPSVEETLKSEPATETSTPTSQGRVIRPPSKQSVPPAHSVQPAPQKQEPAKPTGQKVFVVGEAGDSLRQELSAFLAEIGVEEFFFPRERGKMLPLNNPPDLAGVSYAFFIANTDDMTYLMFELGHFLGKLGMGKVCVIHPTDVKLPQGIPGIVDKPIAIKLEEAALGIMKELKTAGYKITL